MSEEIESNPFPYEVEIDGQVYTVLAPEGEAGYRVDTPNGGGVTAYAAQSGEPSPANAAADIAYAIANPPAPVVAIPAEVPAWRIHAVVALSGLTTAIDTFIAALPEPNQTVARMAWQQGNVIERQSLTVAAIIAAEIVTAEQADALFIQAAALQV